MADEEEIANVVPLLLSTGKRGNCKLLLKLSEEYGDKLPLDGKDGLGNTALHYACFGQHQDAVEILVKLGAPINQQNLAGDTPLHKAVEKNYFSIAKFLITKGATPDEKNKKGQSPINMSKSTEMRKLLKETTHEKELQSIGLGTGAGPGGDADMLDEDMLCDEDDE
uniref:Uncharacterized protein n=1 Tax=Paramoeba aestuarina TaxID=180227 RepID=A0A7S4L221_9EUKA|eukprot:CAMPEP_0201541324 /NCGR_PEP_ID=MMETSP0161_2-20130828/71419_1 /ASSEMBLY_ACC=CAM_ASM_000251 /TAXON_ID=180227 /ORGANISM="Neoparamoeba aestuarina, Strain SoJaBio B1-5/56/2" /LENGTH=166 /DNA_ID=CAMNT_0047948857 /DNA_START=596 /DNA_END=1096 /DNA_ORIENTATION=-